MDKLQSLTPSKLKNVGKSDSKVPTEPAPRINADDSTHGASASAVDSITNPKAIQGPQVFATRFLGWKHQIKDLMQYFEKVASHENHTATELQKAAKSLRLPFPEGELFAGTDGMQAVFYHVHDKTREIAEKHKSFGTWVQTSLVAQLNTAREDVKQHIRFIQKGALHHSQIVAKERDKSIKQMTDFHKSVSAFESKSHMKATDDPHITNILLESQLQHQIECENVLTRETIEMQRRSASFEASLCQVIPRVWTEYHQRQQAIAEELQAQWTELHALLQKIDPKNEWTHFSARKEFFIEEDAPLRDPSQMQYQHQNHDSTNVVHSGILLKKKRFTNKYVERTFILTPAGYLHQFPSHQVESMNPQMSLYLPHCHIVPPPSSDDPNTLAAGPGSAGVDAAVAHELHIEPLEGEKHPATKQGGILTKAGLKNKKGYVFRGRTAAELNTWYEKFNSVIATHEDRAGVDKSVLALGTPQVASPEAASADKVPVTDANASAQPATADGPEEEVFEDADDGSSIEEEEEEGISPTAVYASKDGPAFTTPEPGVINTHRPIMLLKPQKPVLPNPPSPDASTSSLDVSSPAAADPIQGPGVPAATQNSKFSEKEVGETESTLANSTTQTSYTPTKPEKKGTLKGMMNKIKKMTS